MLISLNWLKDFINVPPQITPAKLGELLTLHTVEVEAVRKLGGNLAKVVVGEIIKLKPHPNADRLKLATVNIGKETKRVVCGGSNLSVGMKVAFAKVGARIRWHGQGELMELQPAEIRGVKSAGMICAAAELGLESLFPAKAEREVIDLIKYPTPLTPPQKGGEKILGRPLAEFLGLDEVVYEIDNKSMTHRPDLWSHYGMARDLAAVLPSPLTPLPLQPLGRLRGRGKIKLEVKVEDSKLCPRYMAVAVDNLEIKPSPEWMRKRLAACGQRPINNIVDVSNYVMLELGQPTHAFDLSRIATQTVTNSHECNIVVRRAKRSETITTLDGQERKLDAEMLLITDGKNPVAIAGVMGGRISEVDSNTTGIVIESANFNPVSIRRTSQKLGLRSEASMRFEKSLDPNLCAVALQRIVSLIKISCPQAVITSNLADIKNFKLNQGPIKLDLNWLNKKVGAEIPKAKTIKILKDLGFETSPSTPLLSKERGKRGEVINVKAPTWRATKDISIPEDLAEEAARIYGYQNIKPAAPQVLMQAPAANAEREFINRLRDVLSGPAAMTEVYNYSFVNAGQLAKLGIGAHSHIKLANPLTQDHTLLRQSLIPALLQNVAANQRQTAEIKIYEVGRVFLPAAGELTKGGGKQEKLPQQPIKLGLVCAGKEEREHANYFKLKGIAEHLAGSLGLQFEFSPYSQPGGGAAAKITSENKIIGAVYWHNDASLREAGIKVNTAVCEFDIAELFKVCQPMGIKKHQAKDKFPYVRRDMAFVVNEKILYNDFRRTLLAAHSLIKEVELFDVYQGGKLGPGEKSWAFNLTFGHSQKTLTGAEVDQAQKEIADKMAKKYGAQLRDF